MCIRTSVADNHLSHCLGNASVAMPTARRHGRPPQPSAAAATGNREVRFVITVIITLPPREGCEELRRVCLSVCPMHHMSKTTRMNLFTKFLCTSFHGRGLVPIGRRRDYVPRCREEKHISNPKMYTADYFWQHPISNTTRQSWITDFVLRAQSTYDEYAYRSMWSRFSV